MKLYNLKSKNFLISIFIFLNLCGGFLFWFYGINFYGTEILKGSEKKDIDSAFESSDAYSVKYDLGWSIMNCFFVLSVVPLLLLLNIPSFTDVYYFLRNRYKNCR